MDGCRHLIVNADDFGLSEGTNRGIIEAHERGIVTSASLMVRKPAAQTAVQYAHSRPALAIGLHIDLGEWEWRDDAWMQTDHVVSTDDREAVVAAVGRQHDAFRALMGRDPTHLDSHQHIHHHEPVRSIALELAKSLGVPLRDTGGGIAYCGHFYGLGWRNTPHREGITVANLLAILRSLPPGISELGCHPGRDETLASCYRDERLIEVETLCDPEVRYVLACERIALRSFADALL